MTSLDDHLLAAPHDEPSAVILTFLCARPWISPISGEHVRGFGSQLLREASHRVIVKLSKPHQNLNSFWPVHVVTTMRASNRMNHRLYLDSTLAI